MSNTCFGVNAYELKLCIIIDYCHLQSHWMLESRNKRAPRSVYDSIPNIVPNAGDLQFSHYRDEIQFQK